jgi:SagB-type dehydrogenase family enzyme
MSKTMETLRDFMKGYFVADFASPDNDFNSSDQQKGCEAPPLQKEDTPPNAGIVALPEFDEAILKESNIIRVMAERRSRRVFSGAPLSLKELSYLLWATQGVNRVSEDRVWSLRTVPSAGGRHPYETYLIVNLVDDLDKGLYRYLPLSHELLFISNDADTRDRVFLATYREKFVAEAPVCFVWSCVAYRGEWRYNSKAHKSMLLDAGHICHSLYLSTESVNCGTCAIGGYHQGGFDALLGLDGTNEFTVYLAAVGKRE